MARWHLTLGLTAASLAALFIAPRLVGHGPAAPPLPEPPPIPEAPTTPTGGLRLEAGLDHTAILGQGEERFLAITVTAPNDGGDVMDRPVDLSVVIDASGSMSAQGKIEYARQAARMLASSLDRDDRFSLVVFNDAARTLIPAVPVDDPSALHRAIDGIYEGGGTNLYAGLEQGADQVRSSLRPGMVGRVVVLSDGHANVGLTSAAAFERFSAELSATGVAVSAIGLGRDYNEDLLAKMADLGGGSYDYVDDPRELAGVLADELERTASVVARGVRVKVKLPPNVEPLDVIGWDATREADGWSLWLGDVYAGETRKIITRVRVGAAPEGELAVASVSADYHDLLLDADAMSTAQARATVTRDRNLAAASVDRDRAVASHRAWGAWHLEQSARAWEAGNREEARRQVSAGKAVLQQAAIDFAEPSLEGDAAQLNALGYVVESAPADSYDGKGALKAAKEGYRALSR